MIYKYKFINDYNCNLIKYKLPALRIYAHDKEYEEKSDSYDFHLIKSKFSTENLYLIFDQYDNYVGEMLKDQISISGDFLDYDDDGYQYDSLQILDNFNKEKFINILSKCLIKLRIYKENIIFK